MIKWSNGFIILSVDSRLLLTERESIDGASFALVKYMLHLTDLGQMFGSSSRDLRVALGESYPNVLSLT